MEQISVSERLQRPCRARERFPIHKGLGDLGEHSDGQRPPGRFTIKSVESLREELQHEDAAGIANGISAVRQGMDRRRGAGSAVAVGPGPGGARDRGHAGRRAPGREPCRSQPAPHARTAALEAARDSGRRGRRADRAEGAVCAADCGRGRQAGADGADGSGSRRADLQDRCRRGRAAGRREHSAGFDRRQRGPLGTGAAFSAWVRFWPLRHSIFR